MVVERNLAELRPPILIVEADGLLRQALGAFFEDEGYTVILAADERQAVACAVQTAPGLVVLDDTSPIVPGVEVVQSLRARFGTDLPILVISVDGHGREQAQRVGAVAYLRKPFSLEILLQLTQQYVRAAPWPHTPLGSSDTGVPWDGASR